MTENQKTKDEGWVNLSTKVPPHIGELFDILAKQRGMKSYELLQLLVNGFITAAKHEGPVTPELKLLLNSLKMDVAFNKAFNFASPTAANEIAQIVLILQQPGKRGFGMMMIDKPYMDNAQVTLCVDSIFERVTEISMASIYKELRQIGVDLDSNSVRETLVIMCDSQRRANLNTEEQWQLPGYGNFHEFGRPIEYGQNTKRKHHKGMETFDRQQRIKFTNEDREQADEEVRRSTYDQCGDCRHCDDNNPYGKTFCDIDDHSVEHDNKACSKFEP